MVIFPCRIISRISPYSRKFPAHEYFLFYSTSKHCKAEVKSFWQHLFVPFPFKKQIVLFCMSVTTDVGLHGINCIFQFIHFLVSFQVISHRQQPHRSKMTSPTTNQITEHILSNRGTAFNLITDQISKSSKPSNPNAMNHKRANQRAGLVGITSLKALTNQKKAFKRRVT